MPVGYISYIKLFCGKENLRKTVAEVCLGFCRTRTSIIIQKIHNTMYNIIHFAYWHVFQTFLYFSTARRGTLHVYMCTYSVATFVLLPSHFVNIFSTSFRPNSTKFRQKQFDEFFRRPNVVSYQASIRQLVFDEKSWFPSVIV